MITRAQRRAIERAIAKGKLTVIEDAMYSHPTEPRMIFTKRRPSLAARLFVASLLVSAGGGLIFLFSNYL